MHRSITLKQNRTAQKETNSCYGLPTPLARVPLVRGQHFAVAAKDVGHVVVWRRSHDASPACRVCDALRKPQQSVALGTQFGGIPAAVRSATCYSLINRHG